MGNRRQRKKAAKRAERSLVGTIPGVRGYEEGTGQSGWGLLPPSWQNYLDQERASLAARNSDEWRDAVGGQMQQDAASQYPEGSNEYFQALGYEQIGENKWRNPEDNSTYTAWVSADTGGGTGSYGGTGSSTPQWRPGELELEQRGLDLTQRDQDMRQRAADLDRELQAARNEWEEAIARGDLRVRQQAERRMRETMELQAENNYQLLQLERARLRLDEEQQAFDMQTGVANQWGQLATNRGNIEARRAEHIGGLLANPRDSVQAQYALGGGSSFVQNLLQGQNAGGQATGIAGNTSSLGSGFAEALRQITARPDVEYFDQAAAALGAIPSQYGPAQQQEALGRTDPAALQAQVAATAQQSPQAMRQLQDAMRQQQMSMKMAIQEHGRASPGYAREFAQNANLPGFAKGGSLVVQEPIVATGQVSGKPYFTAGEGFKPEKIDITPLPQFAQGGSAKVGGGPTLPPRPGPPLPTPPPAAPGPQPTMTTPGIPAPVNAPPAQPTFYAPEPIPAFEGLTAQQIQEYIAANLPSGAADTFGGTAVPSQTWMDPEGQQMAGYMPIARHFLGDERFNSLFGPGPGEAEQARILAYAQANPGLMNKLIADIQAARLQQQAAMNELPRSPNDAIRRLSTMSPRQYHSMMPSTRQTIQGLVSGLGTYEQPGTQDWTTSMLAQMPRGANPNSVSFGNFRDGGTILVGAA